MVYASDWKAPGSAADFWEPVFHAALARDSVFVPGAHGSIIQLDKAAGAAISRIAPFGTDPNTWQTGPITVDSQGNLYYSAIQVTVDPVSGFSGNEATDSWLVKIIGSSAAVASYKTLTSPDAPGPTGQCVTGFSASQPPWPPNADAVPPTSPYGTQRVALHVAPAVGPDGTIYSVTRAHFNDRYGYLVAVNPDLTRKWGCVPAESFERRMRRTRFGRRVASAQRRSRRLPRWREAGPGSRHQPAWGWPSDRRWFLFTQE